MADLSGVPQQSRRSLDFRGIEIGNGGARAGAAQRQECEDRRDSEYHLAHLWVPFCHLNGAIAGCQALTFVSSGNIRTNRRCSP
jgi:hypothetical protein